MMDVFVDIGVVVWIFVVEGLIEVEEEEFRVEFIKVEEEIVILC